MWRIWSKGSFLFLTFKNLTFASSMKEITDVWWSWQLLNKKLLLVIFFISFTCIHSVEFRSLGLGSHDQLYITNWKWVFLLSSRTDITSLKTKVKNVSGCWQDEKWKQNLIHFLLQPKFQAATKRFALKYGQTPQKGAKILYQINFSYAKNIVLSI